jgi:transcription elongation factor Elf1
MTVECRKCGSHKVSGLYDKKTFAHLHICEDCGYESMEKLTEGERQWLLEEAKK